MVDFHETAVPVGNPMLARGTAYSVPSRHAAEQTKLYFCGEWKERAVPVALAKSPSPNPHRQILSGVRDLIQNPRPDRSRNLLQPLLDLQRLRASLGFDIDHDVTDLRIGLQVLAGDVDLLFGENRVDAG